MPFINLNKTSINLNINYDYTIIGAGAVGILLAIKLSNLGKRVCLLESGHFTEDERKQNLNQVVNTAKILGTAVWGRKRAIGGTTIAWGGQSLPFSKLDFETKPWLENSGWPIDYDELAHYYDEANAFMGIDKWGYHDTMLSKLGLLKYKFENADFDFHVSKWAKEPNFYKLYKKQLEGKVDVYYNTTVLTINYKDNSATGLKITNDLRQEFEVPVSKLIIACGGIETTRLLLISKLSKSTWLGKCFMEHPCIEFGEIQPSDRYKIQYIFNTHILALKKYSLRLSLTEDFQKTNGVLNASVSVLFKYDSETFNPYQELKSIISGFKTNRISSLIFHLKDILSTVYSIVRYGFIYKPQAKAMLTLMMEQEATVESSIGLSEELDAFLQPKAAITWQISPMNKKTLLKVCDASVKYFEANKLGTVKIHPHIYKESRDINELLSGVNHHMGGTRFGSSAETSVVDKNLKLWDCENVYVCSSSVFPTSSHSNPTLTTLALACRLTNYFQEI